MPATELLSAAPDTFTRPIRMAPQFHAGCRCSGKDRAVCSRPQLKRKRFGWGFMFGFVWFTPILDQFRPLHAAIQSQMGADLCRDGAGAR